MADKKILFRFEGESNEYEIATDPHARFCKALLGSYLYPFCLRKGKDVRDLVNLRTVYGSGNTIRVIRYEFVSGEFRKIK